MILSLGFQLTHRFASWNELLDIIIFGGFILIYLGRLVLTSNHKQLIKNRVLETATYFTFMGQVVILLLIQIGGIWIITFATPVCALYQQWAGGRADDFLKDVDSVSLAVARRDRSKKYHYSYESVSVG